MAIHSRLILAFMLASFPIILPGCEDLASAPQASAPAALPDTDLEYTILRQWAPDDARRGLGIEVLLADSDVGEQQLRDFIRALSADRDPVVIRAFTSKTAYEQEQTNNFGPEYKSDYIFFYVKNTTGTGAYAGFNEIRWMQETGKCSDKYGSKTPL